MLKKVLFMLMFLPALGLADIPRGEKLVQRLWRDMKAQKVEKIKEYTSKEFQGLISGRAVNRFQELDLIKNTTILSYTLTDITATQGENIIVVTYIADVVLRTGFGQVETISPRITVWKKFDDGWKWIAQADLIVGGPFNPAAPV